ncbi:type IV secretion system protein [Sulfurospirillum sp. T05]|uniref:Type IV secretion system protein n=1 Tax=Sulfurospirillum tamanense TaxID=2813362 RepID=A0ABS2WUD7_9BACT|nr:type IV secretion system protein [Sulfurospirillum tamanensis]MBN2965267.1 type IV secretion system protein [Sulfurospirillum tamanensis]
MISLFSGANAILETTTTYVQEGMYRGAQLIYDNAFFTSALTLSIIIFGVMFSFRKFQSEEAVYQVVWTLLVFSFVKTMLLSTNSYDFFVEILRIPSKVFTEAVSQVWQAAGVQKTMKEILDSIQTSNVNLLEMVRAEGGIRNWFPFFISTVIWLVGTFLMVTIIMMLLVSAFLAELVLSLAPLILPALVFSKTQGVFFQWMRLYISLSLYAPFTLLFGVVLIQVNKLIQQGVVALRKEGFAENTEFILVVIVVQLIVILGIYRIPNIINQIIGSSNEGSSLSGSVGTASAGVTMLMGASKLSGVNLAGKGVEKGMDGIVKKLSGGAAIEPRPRVTVSPH